MPVQINELSAEIEVASPSAAGSGVEMPTEDAQRELERFEWVQRRQQQLAERVAAWGLDD